MDETKALPSGVGTAARGDHWFLDNYLTDLLCEGPTNTGLSIC